MIKYIKSRLFIILFPSLLCCIEKINLRVDEVPILVVDGLITDEPGPYKVQIDFSSGFNVNPLFVENQDLVRDAIVTIVDDVGNEETLMEDPHVPGQYWTSPNGIRGEIGRTYQLFITLKNNNEYQSRPETIMPVSGIDDIYIEIEQKEIISGTGGLSSEELINFFVEFKDPVGINNFYRWRYVEVFEYIARLADEKQAIRDASPQPQGEFPPMELSPIIKQCWVTSFDQEFLNILDDNLFDGSLVNRHKVVSLVPDRKFLTNYSILIKQLSLTERGYNFFKNIESQVENTGTIFETSNFQIQGNIDSVGDQNTVILGYFGASAVQSKRIIISPSDLNLGSTIPEYDCSPKIDTNETPIACEDCTKFPGISTSIKPSYWPD